MKFILLHLFLLSTIVSFGQQNTNAYFPWVQDNKLCFIDAKGNIQLTGDKSVSYPKTSSIDVGDLYSSYQVGTNWGLKDLKGNIVIKAGYEKIGNVKNSLVWVKLDHKRYYYINLQEEPLINYTFDRCYDFSEGLARVKDKNPTKGYDGFGYLNTNGEVVIPLTYRKAYDFVGGHALIQEKDKSWWIINQANEKVHGPVKDLKSFGGRFSLE